MAEYLSHSLQETESLAKDFAKKVQVPSVIAFFGDLGSGKTTFIRAFASHFGIASINVSSPTFQYLHIYKGINPIYHFDLYRLGQSSEFFDMGFDEFFASNGITCIEWAERIEHFLPKKTITVRLEHVQESIRRIVIDEN